MRNQFPKLKEELIGYLETIQQFDKDSAQDATALHAYLLDLTQFGARANYLKAELGRIFRQEKKQAYLNLAASQQATQKYYAPSLEKDYVDACCNESGYMYDLADRCAAQCVHTIDAIRTIISSLKSERQFAGV